MGHTILASDFNSQRSFMRFGVAHRHRQVEPPLGNEAIDLLLSNSIYGTSGIVRNHKEALGKGFGVEWESVLTGSTLGFTGKEKPISCTGALVFHPLSSPPGPQRPAFSVPSNSAGPGLPTSSRSPTSVAGINLGDVHPAAVGLVIVLGTSSRKTHHSHIRTDDSRKGASILGISDLPITLAYQLLSTDGD